MNIFIDGEWNSYGGDLISMALVAEDGRDFYEVLGCKNPDPWVAENVMPKLNKDPISLVIFQLELAKYLMQFESEAVHIIADWPEDIMWFCKVLVTGPETRLNTPPLTMQVLRVDTVSQNPHNALADAQALRDWCVNVDMNSVRSNTCRTYQRRGNWRQIPNHLFSATGEKMTRDDIVRMVQDAAIMPPNWGATENQWRSLEEFAKLVAEHERDRLHDKFMAIHESQKHSNNYWHFAARQIKENT